MTIFLYGPPSSGKSTLGRLLASSLELPFYDLDEEIEAAAHRSIPEIFAAQGEPVFRQLESAQLTRLLTVPGTCVVALGGGALLDENNRAMVEQAGCVICLNAPIDVLLKRMQGIQNGRPLLEGDLPDRLERLLRHRAGHYGSFLHQMDSSQLPPGELVWHIQTLAGHFRVTGMGSGYDVIVSSGVVDSIGRELLDRDLREPVALVSDEHVSPLYAPRVLQSLQSAGLHPSLITLPAGEAHKNLKTLKSLWESLLSARIDRQSTILAMGGGVVTDLAGFAAATFLRGVRWAAVPTSLLGMVDASLGGKTGIDLPQGKNLVGSFYPLSLVLADPQALATLPAAEIKNGLAEALKNAAIDDPGLFHDLSLGWNAFSNNQAELESILRRSMAVKIRILIKDPYERGLRIVLNLGHTLGHAFEWASNYTLRHGEAVAMGLVAEARIGEALGVTERGVARQFEQALTALDLPVTAPADLPLDLVRKALENDKKRQSQKIRLPLLVHIGQVTENFEIEEEGLWSLFLSCMAQT